MAEYIATNGDGFTLFIGDAVFGPNGAQRIFEGVVGHDPEGGGMMIKVSGATDYAAYWDVYVEEIEDEPDWFFYDAEEDYSGYYAEEEYFGDLEHEYDDIY